MEKETQLEWNWIKSIVISGLLLMLTIISADKVKSSDDIPNINNSEYGKSFKYVQLKNSPSEQENEEMDDQDSEEAEGYMESVQENTDDPEGLEENLIQSDVENQLETEANDPEGLKENIEKAEAYEQKEEEAYDPEGLKENIEKAEAYEQKEEEAYDPEGLKENIEKGQINE